ncbi:hypothetical protein O6H91_02G149100 [Diphasiastrum complanatum]|uniref:Uncharacterized protein n=1 Tax=Diphasiastrum complanatum TaxID=34168 RepID=A0ACC2ELR9_DIPCM|nr:hypothetical protein O6H91_02G149100 [Diphasiastrum complanatum]
MSKFGRKLVTSAKMKMNPVLHLMVFWFLALVLVFEKSVSASRLLGAYFKPELNTSVMDHIHNKHAVESIEPQEKLAKGASIGSIASEGMEVTSENEHEWSWLNTKDISSNSGLLSLVTKLPSIAVQVEKSNVEYAIRGLQDEIDYNGQSTHPPREGH